MPFGLELPLDAVRPFACASCKQPWWKHLVWGECMTVASQHEFLTHCAHKLVFAEWLLSLRWGSYRHAGDLLNAIQDAVSGSGNAASSDPVRVAHLIQGAWQAGWLRPGSFEAWHIVAKSRLAFPGGLTNHRAGQLVNAKLEKDAKGQPIGDVLCYCWTLGEGIPGSIAVRWAQSGFEVTP